MRRLLPLLLACLVLLSACAGAGRRMRDQRDRGALTEAVQGYWDAVRWNDAARASTWLADPKDQLALGRLVSEPRYRVSDVVIVQLALGEELPEERLPERREATALVRLEVADAVRYKGETVTVEQHWIKRERAWYVDTARSPLGADRPW